VFNPAPQGGGDQRAAATSASRSVTTAAYTDFWQGAGVDRAKLAQALPPLPDTADELNEVAKDLGVGASDIHLGADASEATVKRAPLADYGIIYFATHGLVAGDVKGLAEPSLALSIPKQPSELDDGLLTSSEVAQLKLNADWVVLSACNTPKPCPAWRGRSSMPAQERFWSRIGRWIRKPRPGLPPRPSGD
jgi:CHAT domain-containing protein